MWPYAYRIHTIENPRHKPEVSYFLYEIYKPNSVPSRDCGIRGVIIYLGLLLPIASSGTQPTLHVGSTALHRSKDLAVSIPCCHKNNPERIPLTFAAGVSVRTSTLTRDGRYPLPFFQHHFYYSNCINMQSKIGSYSAMV